MIDNGTDSDDERPAPTDVKKRVKVKVKDNRIDWGDAKVVKRDRKKDKGGVGNGSKYEAPRIPVDR